MMKEILFAVVDGPRWELMVASLGSSTFTTVTIRASSANETDPFTQ